MSDTGSAPKVTEDDIKANIAAVHYFNMGEAAGALGQPDHPTLGLLTICVLILKNGIKVVGESACVSAANFNREFGEKLAYADAFKKVWPMMGYALADHLMYGGQSYWAQPAEDQG